MIGHDDKECENKLLEASSRAYDDSLRYSPFHKLEWHETFLPPAMHLAGSRSGQLAVVAPLSLDYVVLAASPNTCMGK